MREGGEEQKSFTSTGFDTGGGMTGNGSTFKSHRLSFVVVVDGGGGGGDGVVITGVEVAGVDPQKSSMSDG